MSNNNFTGNLPNIKIDSFDSNFRVYISIDFSNNDLEGCYLNSYCDYLKDGQIILDWGVNLNDNPKLPWKGDITYYCSGQVYDEKQIFAFCDDGNDNSLNDQINLNCECLGVIDTCTVTIYDTIIVRDTITETISDTTFITITETISVTDTLIINLNIPNAPNDPVTNRIIVYPNPASTHVYIDFGDHTLMQNYSCQILNALGQPIFFTPIDQKLYYLDLNTWGGKGTYFIKIINDFGQTVETKKIILQ